MIACIFNMLTIYLAMPSSVLARSLSCLEKKYHYRQFIALLGALRFNALVALTRASRTWTRSSPCPTPSWWPAATWASKSRRRRSSSLRSRFGMAYDVTYSLHRSGDTFTMTILTLNARNRFGMTGDLPFHFTILLSWQLENCQARHLPFFNPSPAWL